MFTLHVVSHTHWDREWHLTFQQFRFRLMRLVEELLDILESDPGYRHFMLDGQAVILEDVTDVRPDLEEPLRHHVRAGRILIGPWFVLPDEFLVSPEALVRNLLLGDRICRAWGAKMGLGYIPDSFGHISQLPQLLRGFDIETTVFWRGAGEAPVEFRWAAPDGTEVLVCYLRDSYGNAALLPADEAGVVQALVEARDSLAPYAMTSHLLLMQGTDHMRPRADLPRLLTAAGRPLPDRVVHSSLPAYVASVRAELGEEGLRGLPLRVGEMRNPSRAHLLPGVLSTRMWIKQRNHACQTLLERWAEPFAALASLQGCRSGRLACFIRRAWRYLLENHPHDSICGCSVDQVHREMTTRFDWCEQIGEEVTRTALEGLAAQVDTGTGGLPVLVVFNPSATPRTDRVVARMLPVAAPERVTLVGPDGMSLPFRVARHAFRSEVEIAFVARDVPPLGYATYRFVPAEARSPQSEVSGLQASDLGRVVENEFFRVEADPQMGRLTVVDKETGLTLRGCNRFVDGGDRGDEYNYCRPEKDRLVADPVEPPLIHRRADEVGESLILQMTYLVPEGLDPADRSARGREMIALPIIVRVTLTPGVRRVDFETTVENRARDHRLRVHFPSPLAVDNGSAEAHWDVVKWPLHLPTDTEGWVEQPVPTHPQRGWASVSDGVAGVTLANRGLPEVEVLHTPPSRTACGAQQGGAEIALTLLRCVGWLSRDDLHCREGHAGPALPVPEAQCPGRHTFRYALIPHGGDWRAALADAEAFQTDLRVVATPAHPGQLPPALSFIRVEPDALQVSAIKISEEGERLILRLWNARELPLEGTVRLWRRFAHAVRTDMAERTSGPELARDADAVEVTVRGREVVTLCFAF